MSIKVKKSTVFLVIGCLLLLAALGLTIYNIWDNWRAGRAAESIAVQFAQLSLAHVDREQEIPEYILNPDMDMPSATVDGHEYIGMLEVPALGLKLPVMAEWSYANLKLSPCRYDGSAYKNNLVIAAHNYKSHFGGIKNLKVGDFVIFTDALGNVFSYKVLDKEMLEADDITDMIAGDWDLTLFTCTTGGQFRVAVRCEINNQAVR